MKSITLNIGKRKGIVANIMEAYDKKHTAPIVIDERNTNLHKALIRLYRERNKAIITLYESCTDTLKKYFKVSRSFYYAGGGYGSWNCVSFNEFSKEDKNIYLPQSNETLINLDNVDEKIPAYLQKVLDNNKLAYKSIKAEKEVLSEFNTTRNKYKEKIWEVLNSVRSTKQLIDLWPESKDYFPTYFGETSCTALAVNIEDLNSQIRN